MKVARKSLCRDKFISLAAAVCASFAANAATNYWQGAESDDPLVAGNYSSDMNGKARLTALPEPGDTIRCSGKDISFDDESIAFLSSLGNVEMYTGTERCVINISTDAVVSAKIDYNGKGAVVKRGAGTLALNGELVPSTKNNCDSYYTGFIVEEGDLVFPQSIQSSGNSTTVRHGMLQVASGSSVTLDGGLATTAFNLSVKGLSGAGNVAYTNVAQLCTFTVTGGTNALFSGVLSGDNLALTVKGDLMLDNAANTFAYGGSGKITFESGTLGFRNFGSQTGGASSFGNLTASNAIYFNKPDDIAFLCLADGEQTGARVIQGYGSGAITFDGGAYGGFTFSGNLKVCHNSMTELVLTGSNTETCVWYGQISEQTSGTGYYYLTKRGTGTWCMDFVSATSTEDKYAKRMARLAGIGVENGTLAFKQVREAGLMCSLGFAPADHLFGYPLRDTITNAANSNKVAYAIRLGNVSDLSEEGTFEYVGTVAGICTTRPIAVTGRGRIKNSSAEGSGKPCRLYWTGFMSVVPPENASLVPALSTLTFDGSMDNGSRKGDGWATNITEEVGAAPLRIAKEGTAAWTLGGELGFSGGIDVREGTLNVAAEVSASQPYLRCDGGATLNASGGSVTATGFAVDVAKGIGRISGVTFAETGTICFTNVVGGAASVSCNLRGCTGLENIEKWDVVVNGEANPRMVVKVTTTELRYKEKRIFGLILR